MRKWLTVQSLLYVSLILALLASLNHVAYAFSTVNGGDLITGYIAAVAVDFGLLAIAGGINKYKAQGRLTRNLWGGVIFFSLISVYANWLAGIVHVQPIAADVGRLGTWLVSLRPIILSAVLPCLVIYLSEIVSGDYQRAQKEAAREAKKEAKQAVKTTAPASTLAQANETRQAGKQARMKKLERLYQQDPAASVTDLAAEIGVSRATVRNYADALGLKLGQTNGQVSR